MNTRQRGLSLIELMIATTLGLLSLAAVGNMFVGGSGNYRQGEKISRMHDELAYAMAQLTQDVEMAGFWSQVRDGALIGKPASLNIGNECGPSGWSLDLTPLALDDNPSAAQASAAHPCLSAAEIQPGADLAAVKRVRGRSDASDLSAAGLVMGRTYLRTHLMQGTLHVAGSGSPGVDAPYQDWEYRPRLYFIQPYSASPLESPRIPSLCRMVLRPGTPPAYAKECIAQGVENMQFEVGVDSDGDGVANYFSPAPGADVARAVAVRVYLLVRSAAPDPRYSNAKTYWVGNAPALQPVGDDRKYYRKTLSTEVALRNARALSGLGFQ